MDPADLDLTFSVSATNRAPRPGEVDGVNYHFLTDEQFHSLIAQGAFAEYEQVYPGRYYGTLKEELQRNIDAGHNVILDIDVCGGVNVKEQFGADALSIFIAPPSIPELRRRLEQRASDSAAAIDQRVERAAYELSFQPRYDHVVINDKLPEAVDIVRALITDFIK